MGPKKKGFCSKINVSFEIAVFCELTWSGANKNWAWNWKLMWLVQQLSLEKMFLTKMVS